MSALRGSGALQKQFATIVVVNPGQIACWLIGYPVVGLRRAGAALGAPAAPATAGRPALQLPPGGRAVAGLHGPTVCNAPLSDSVRIRLAGQSASTDAALVMRGCPLTIDAFAAAPAR